MGWASRRPRKQQADDDGLTELTGERAGRIARSIREGLSSLGVRLSPHHDLERMARQGEMLAALGPGSVFEPWKAAIGAKQNEIADAVFVMEQAERIGGTLQLVPQLRNVEKYRRWLREKLDRLDSQDLTSLDYLFEIEMAGRLARDPELEVSFEEPDIIASFEEHAMLFACKRPRAIESVGASIRKARHQVRDARTLHRSRPTVGVIVVGMEAIFHRPREGAGVEPTFYRFADRAEAQREGERELVKAIVAGTDQAEKACREGVAGLIYFGTIVFFTSRPNAYQNLLFCKTVYNGAIPASDGFIAHLRDVLAAPITGRAGTDGV